MQATTASQSAVPCAHASIAWEGGDHCISVRSHLHHKPLCGLPHASRSTTEAAMLCSILQPLHPFITSLLNFLKGSRKSWHNLEFSLYFSQPDEIQTQLFMFSESLARKEKKKIQLKDLNCQTPTHIFTTLHQMLGTGQTKSDYIFGLSGLHTMRTASTEILH